MTLARTSSIGSLLMLVLLPLALLVFPSPAHATSITATPTSATVGTSVSVRGEGFVGHLATIHWDDQVVAEGMPIDETGELTCTFDVPHACKGEHVIKITDDSHWSGSSASLAFTVLPGLRVFPRVGRQWTKATVTGTGFAASETDIRITWDGKLVDGSPATADSLGEWSATFDIEDAPKGEHFVGAFGNVTDATEVGELLLIISPWAKVQPVSGPVGTEIAIDGFGFRTGEDGITITYDGDIIKCNIVGEADGSWSITLPIPPSVQGDHTVGVYGSSFTPKGIVPDTNFKVIPKIELQPTSGNKGTKVTVMGTGFATTDVITISFDEVTLDTAVVADDTGSFSTTVEVPQTKVTQHTVAALGSAGISAQASFITEKTPPAPPTLLSPSQGARVEVFGSVGEVTIAAFKSLITIAGNLGNGRRAPPGSSTTTFDWSIAAEPETVHYVFQIATADGFSSPVLAKDDLHDSAYSLSEQDVLVPGNYTWRAKAIDDVGNESPWSEAGEFELITVSTRVLILSIAIPLVFVAIVLACIVVPWWMKRSRP